MIPGAMPPAVVLVLPKSGYRNDDFLAAAKRLGAEVIVASDVCHQLADEWAASPVTLRFRDAQAAADELARAVRERKPVAVIGVDDLTALVATLTSARLWLPHNPAEAVAAARSKALSRAKMRDADVAVPRFEVASRDIGGDDLEALLQRAPYPCVVKPLVLSGSRGVIRADDPQALRAALKRVAALLSSPDVAQRRDADLERVLIEDFVPGPEVALEGLLMRGHLHALAIFDKPDPLDGPYFEETIYVTPSRHPPAVVAAVEAATAGAADALGLQEGPVHAELRIPPEGPVTVLELAARSIGGLCARTLRFGTGRSLDELILL